MEEMKGKELRKGLGKEEGAGNGVSAEGGGGGGIELGAVLEVQKQKYTSLQAQSN